jgi:hypothetical protein
MALKASLATYLVGSLFASDAYQVFAYCLIGYICVLQVIARNDRVASRKEFDAPHVTEPVEIGVWQ